MFLELGNYHPIYGPKDFMAVVMHVKDPNFIPVPFPPAEEGTDLTFGTVQASVNVWSLYKLVRIEGGIL